MAPMKAGGSKGSPLLRRYLSAMPAELAALEGDVGRLDRSYESLDQVEDHLIGVATGAVAGDKKLAIVRAARYAGAVLLERTGARWATKKRDAETICVSGFAGYAAQECEPLDLAARVAKHPLLHVGALRDEIERCDLPLRRRQLAALIGEPEARLRELSDDISALTGTVTELDFTPASVDAVESALQVMVSAGTLRAQQRRMRNAAVLYLGTMAVKALGKDEWTVKDRPGVDGFGMFRIHRWQPESNVALVMPASRPGRLREVAEYVLGGGE